MTETSLPQDVWDMIVIELGILHARQLKIPFNLMFCAAVYLQRKWREVCSQRMIYPTTNDRMLLSVRDHHGRFRCCNGRMVAHTCASNNMVAIYVKDAHIYPSLARRQRKHFYVFVDSRTLRNANTVAIRMG